MEDENRSGLDLVDVYARLTGTEPDERLGWAIIAVILLFASVGAVRSFRDMK